MEEVLFSGKCSPCVPMKDQAVFLFQKCQLQIHLGNTQCLDMPLETIIAKIKTEILRHYVSPVKVTMPLR